MNDGPPSFNDDEIRAMEFLLEGVQNDSLLPLCVPNRDRTRWVAVLTTTECVSPEILDWAERHFDFNTSFPEIDPSLTIWDPQSTSGATYCLCCTSPFLDGELIVTMGRLFNTHPSCALRLAQVALGGLHTKTTIELAYEERRNRLEDLQHDDT